MRAPSFVFVLVLVGFGTTALALEDCEVRPPDMRTPGVVGASCDSLSLYYGIDHPRDRAAARLCAYAERARGADGPGLDGPAVLMMVYANAEGVERDIGLAKQFACEASWASAEYQGRIEHLDAMEQDPVSAGGIDYCDHVTSGMIGGLCSDLERRLEEAGRAARYATATKDWTPAQRQAFAAMREVATRFFQASSVGEQDMSGTGRNSFAIDWSEKLENGLIADVMRYEQGRLPRGGSKAARESDARLNAAYRDRLATLQKKSANPDATHFAGTESVE
ncbi:MAG: hypothetical protein ACREER_05900, partial [Alphaproteobacteria bacterium]